MPADEATREIVVRPLAPYGFMAGISSALPTKPLEAPGEILNVFHTGDGGVMNSAGVADTLLTEYSDCIRRRGHNISSFEVENVFLQSGRNPTEVSAAYAVPSSFVGGEDEYHDHIGPRTEDGKTLSHESHCTAWGQAFGPSLHYQDISRFLANCPKHRLARSRRRSSANAGSADDTFGR